MEQQHNEQTGRSGGKRGWFVLLPMVVVAGVVLLALRPGQVEKDVCNVVLISIDTCRADYLGCYGNARNITPNIDGLAAESVLFENVVTPVPMTLPAHCSMLTGMSPLRHRVHDNLGYKLAEPAVTVAEVLVEEGYDTGAIISSFVLDRQFGLAQGFDSYNDKFEEEITTGRYSERRGGEATRFALQWLEEHRDNKFFLFLHYYDPHFRYEPPEPYASEFADDLYAGEIAYTDHCIGRVIQQLTDLGLFESTLLMITGDHGEMLGEHGEAEHGYFIYEPAIKVPLIIFAPGASKGRRVGTTVSLNDIVPTICGVVGAKTPSAAQGLDLSCYLRGRGSGDAERAFYCESITPTKHGANPLLGIVSGEWKYIHTTRCELYNVVEDPQERDNLIKQRPEKAKALAEVLKHKLQQRSRDESSAHKVDVDEQTRRRLESLGYVGSGSVDDRLQVVPDRDDPKDLIKFHNIRAYNDKAVGMIQAGQVEQGVKAYQELIAHYETAEISHSMGTIHFNLAAALQSLGQDQQAREHYAEAVELFREELKNAGDQVMLWVRLGNALASMGDFAGAAEAFQKSVRLQPGNMLYYDNLVKALEFQGRYSKAIEVLEGAIEFMHGERRSEEARRLQKYIEQLRSKQNGAAAPVE